MFRCKELLGYGKLTELVRPNSLSKRYLFRIPVVLRVPETKTPRCRHCFFRLSLTQCYRQSSLFALPEYNGGNHILVLRPMNSMQLHHESKPFVLRHKFVYVGRLYSSFWTTSMSWRLTPISEALCRPTTRRCIFHLSTRPIPLPTVLRKYVDFPPLPKKSLSVEGAGDRAHESARRAELHETMYRGRATCRYRPVGSNNAKF